MAKGDTRLLKCFSDLLNAVKLGVNNNKRGQETVLRHIWWACKSVKLLETPYLEALDGRGFQYWLRYTENKSL